MNTKLNFEINKNFQLSQDIKKLTKQINKFLITYSYKSAFIKSETKDLKHNDYLNIVAKFFGYTDYNQYNKEKNKKIISIESLLLSFEKFLNSLDNNSNYDNKDISQIVNTFHLYITFTEEDLYKEKKRINEKIKRRINNLIKGDKTHYTGSEFERLYKIINNTYFQPIIIDYRSILIYKQNSTESIDSKNTENELVNLLFKFYDLRNTIIIKKYIKEEKFSDNIGEHLYLLEDFLKESFNASYKPFEYIEFLAVQFKHYHHGINDDTNRKIINKFKSYIAEKTIGRSVLVKGVFNTISNEGLKIYRSRAITYNADGEWSIFEITLANNDKLDLIVSNNGTFAIQKYFGDNISCHILLSYDLEKNDKLIWTVPMVERNSSIKERFMYFYPKKPSDKFMLKLSFNDGYDLITLTRDGIFEDGEVKFSFKNMMQILYEDGIQKLQNINVPVEKYIEIYERDYKE